jgi:3-phytase
VSLPDFKLIDNGGIDVFAEDTLRAPMGIALYNDGQEIYAIVSRKTGPESGYLYQYKLSSNVSAVKGDLVRKFGKFSGIKEIESIAVDDELGIVYYSDENVGVRKYNAHPDSSDMELALIGEGDFKEDNEGISIYDTGNGSGYVIVSDQQRGTFNFYDRKTGGLVGTADLETLESDGSEVWSGAVGEKYPKGFFVAMSDDRTFHIYDMRDLLSAIGVE